MIQVFYCFSTTGESKVFYYKMKGDYHRYLAEFATGNDRKEAAENSLVAYKAASDIAMTELPPTHPIRCGVMKYLENIIQLSRLVDWVLRSTSPCSTMRFSILPTVLADLPRYFKKILIEKSPQKSFTFL